MRAAGFTLVEMLVVILVLVLLTALTVPTLRNSMAAAEVVKCRSNLRSLTLAHGLYGSTYNFNKPPLRWPTRSSFAYQLASPNVKMFGHPVGQGLLIAENYIQLRSVLCPGSLMAEDADLDEEMWRLQTISGSSYSYFWRHNDSYDRRSDIMLDYKYIDAENEGRFGLAMDINAQSGHAYIGAYGSNDLVSHPVIGVINIAYSDGSVGSEDNSEIVLRPPFHLRATMKWWELAHKAKKRK